MSSHPRDAFRKHRDGWIVRCPTCGKKSKRMFRADDPDAMMHAERYWTEHIASEMHREKTRR